jgi:hypothetical protein
MSEHKTPELHSWHVAYRVHFLLRNAAGDPFSDVELAVLTVFALHWNHKTGLSSPGIERVSTLVQRSRRTVQKVIRGLEGTGIMAHVDWRGRRDAAGRGRAGSYVLLIIGWPPSQADLVRRPTASPRRHPRPRPRAQSRRRCSYGARAQFCAC